MVGNTQFKLALGIGLAALCVAFNTQATTPYQQWLAGYARTNLASGNYSSPTNPILFVVTAVEGDGLSPTNDHHSIWSKVSKAGSVVTAAGFVYYFRQSGFDASGSDAMRPTISVDTLKRLTNLLAELPSDHARLPPADRRLLVQTEVRPHLLTRVYDRANLPDRLQEILRLAGCYVGTWVPQFAPDSKIDSCGFEFGGFLALSPDRQEIVFALMNQPLQFWNPTAHELLAEVRGLPGLDSSIAYSPDRSLLVVVGGYSEGLCLETKTWKVVKEFHKPRPDGGWSCPKWPVFVTGGRHLLLQYEDGLTIFDTTNWQRILGLPEVPPAALHYIPAPDNKRAIITLKSGAVVLWDVRRQRSVATLAQSVRLSQVSFSPDGFFFATVTARTNDSSNISHSLRLQIWKATNGRLAKEIALEGRTDWIETVNYLVWAPDGEHLLAAARFVSTGCGIDVFNVKNGHFSGYFFGPGGGINGVVLTPDNAQLVAGGNDGKIYFWDFKGAMNKIEALERSLTE
jgi:hypothetical protein